MNEWIVELRAIRKDMEALAFSSDPQEMARAIQLIAEHVKTLAFHVERLRHAELE